MLPSPPLNTKHNVDQPCAQDKPSNTKHSIDLYHELDTVPKTYPYDANAHLMKNGGDLVGQAEYAHIIGSLMHLMNFSRPCIAYAVCILSRYTRNPNNDHCNALARLMKYLRGTMNYGILCSGFSTVLEGYSDANWIFDSDEIKSSSGYVFTFGGGVVALKSSKQTLIATSTMQSEFIALEFVGKEAKWLRNFLWECNQQLRCLCIVIAKQQYRSQKIKHSTGKTNTFV